MRPLPDMRCQVATCTVFQVQPAQVQALHPQPCHSPESMHPLRVCVGVSVGYRTGASPVAHLTYAQVHWVLLGLGELVSAHAHVARVVAQADIGC